MVAVIFYHADFVVGSTAILAGGFLGVDVFFVISGYLITSIILRESEAGQFRFRSFYERRARRILPALLIVTLATLPLARLTMLPDAMVEFAGSALSTLGFASNLWFWLEDSYTAQASVFKPLLHTWSLAVEEQFYLLFPIVLLALRRVAGERLQLYFGVGLLASLQLAQVTSGTHPDAAFYLLHTRGWELLAGAMLAKAELDRGALGSDSPRDQLLAALGLLLVVGSFAAFDDQLRHPSYWTALPVAGTALLVAFARPTAGVGRLLATRGVVAVGLVSYSLYLWHVPVFVFGRLTNETPSAELKVGWIVASAALAAASYWAIERPARNRSRVGLRALLAGIVLASLAVAAGGTTILVKRGFPDRSLAAILSDLDRAPTFQDGEDCNNRPIERACRFPGRPGAPRILLVGDSHAAALTESLRDWAGRSGAELVPLTGASCLHFHGLQRRDRGAVRKDCERRTRALRAYLEKQPPSVIVYAARLAFQIEGTRFDNREGGVEPGVEPRLEVTPRRLERAPDATVASEIQRNVERWIRLGHRVVLVYPIPEVGWDLPRHVKGMLDPVPEAERLEAFRRLAVTTSYAVYRERARSSVEILDALGERPSLRRIHPDRLFCSAETGRCHTHDERSLFYADRNHLSRIGAKRLVAEIGPAIEALSTDHPDGDE